MTDANAAKVSDLNLFDQRDDTLANSDEPDLSVVEQALVHELFDAWNQYSKSNPNSKGPSDDYRNAVLDVDLVIYDLREIHPLYSDVTHAIDRLHDGETDAVYRGLKPFYVGIEDLAQSWVSLRGETQALEIAKKTLRVDAAVIELVALSPEYR